MFLADCAQEVIDRQIGSVANAKTLPDDEIMNCSPKCAFVETSSGVHGLSSPEQNDSLFAQAVGAYTFLRALEGRFYETHRQEPAADFVGDNRRPRADPKLSAHCCDRSGKPHARQPFPG